MSIPKQAAKKQAMRLSQMIGFPATEEALGEMVRAIEAAMSEDMAAKVVSAILDDATSTNRCPMPGEVRRLILARVKTRPLMKDCRICNNAGFQIVHKLVTYRPGSYEITTSETLRLEFEDRLNFEQLLKENQRVLSCAAPCVCLPADHKILTGERD